MSICEACGADLDTEPHQTSQGQHDVTGTLTLELPPLDLPEITSGQ